MPRFIVTVQAQLEANNTGPHFSITLDSTSYVAALHDAAPHLEASLAASGLAVRPVPALPQDVAPEPTPPAA